MDIGEMAALAMTKDDTQCPFCKSKSKAKPKLEELELVNDSSKLAGNSKPKPKKKIDSPPCNADYLIFEDYWKGKDKSEVVPNAHHVIPGNAALARTPKVLRWMAAKVSVKKVEKGATVSKTVRSKAKKQSAAARKKAGKIGGKQIVDTRPLVEDKAGEIAWTVQGKKIDRHYKPVKDDYVFGIFYDEFDINLRLNNIWLPSHCAIADWTAVKRKPAWHMNQDPEKDKPIPFEEAYAYNAMEVFYTQFHDSHGTYSKEVVKQLKKIDAKLTESAKKCLQHPNTKSKKGHYPAPTNLIIALRKLSRLTKDKLDIAKTFPEHPWYTSKLALKVSDKYWD